MIPSTLLFVAGVVLLQFQAQLPSWPWVLSIPLLLVCLWRLPRVTPLAAFALGFLWALADAHWSTGAPFPESMEGRDVQIEGVIDSLPERRSDGLRFYFEVDSLRFNDKSYPSPGRIQLSWYQTEQSLAPGDRWRLVTRLKAVHGFMNPAGFDYEGWLYRKGISIRGYVRRDSTNHRIDGPSPMFGLQNLRQTIGMGIDVSVEDSRAAGLLRAVVIGDRSGLSKEHWELFRLTGTNHLIAISGLHIGIVSGLVFYLGIRIWRFIPLVPLYIPAPKAAAVAALLAGSFYAGLAGFSIPTQRALLMLGVFMGSYLLSRASRPSRSFALAMLFIVILEPTAVLSPGFWLSFLAVFIILLGVTGRVRQAGTLLLWGRMQWLIALGMAPALLVWQFQFPLVAPLVNLLAVPLFSFIVIPLCLTATIVSLFSLSLGEPLLRLGGWLLSAGMDMLEWVAQANLVLEATPGLSPWLWVFIGAGSLMLLAPAGIPGRWLGLLMLLPLALHSPVKPGKEEVWLDLLDVGQGLAMVIRTSGHTLVYDTGPRYSSSFDTGSAVLIPFLHAQGIKKIDKVVLSNGDEDHKGGFTSLSRRFPIGQVLSGEPGRIEGSSADLCLAGKQWIWEGARFQILHPDDRSSWVGNDASCVLSVESAGGRILIAGDIEKSAERRLVSKYKDYLDTDLLLVPHHGSRTSSTKALVAAANPGFALVAAGYLNRYRFPKAEIVSRWEAQGARVMTTAEYGSISFRLSPGKGIEGPYAYRETHGRYWSHKPGRDPR
ncbi:MAG: DNA internalization-related competence protein ComEC/Rec2 [Gammaproteobacteria bacterium]|nr:DNA internalization-related competence protein ComEC/Rec2 [Gammaproteobacteria bacterium]